MREQRIILEPFEMVDILQCSGKVCGDSHGYMLIKGHIRSNKEETYLRMLQGDTWVSVQACSVDGKKSILFSGIATEGNIENENGVKALSLTIRSGSFLMDLKNHMRTFQDSKITYDKILSSVLTDSYPDKGFIMTKGKGQGIGEFLCQYQETDWQFLRRLASYCGVGLFPNYVGNGVKFYFGLPHGVNHGKINATEYFQKQTMNELIYGVRLREIFDIGDTVIFQGKFLHIISRETKYTKGELYHLYELTQQQNNAVDLIHNDNLTGVSLKASVTRVEGTSVSVSVKEDENRNESGSRLFSYATVYSSPDGTGWYCMPEVGDEVRLYFPSNREGEAYVFSSVHLKSENGDERSNPNFKSIMNKQGKEILFKPNSILITNNAGMSLEMSDEEGISIISDKKITLQSDKAIEIISEKECVDIIAPKQISLKQGNTDVVLSDSLTMKGAKIRLD